MMSTAIDATDTGGSEPPHDPTPTEPAVSPTPDPQWQQVIVVAARADLFASQNGTPISEFQRRLGPGLVFNGPQGGVSKRSAPARPGEVYRVTTKVKAEGEGDTPPVHVGPMFLDARDQVLFHSVSIPLLSVGVEHPVDVEVAAPPRTVAVRLRIVGGWAEGVDSTKFMYTFGTTTLYRSST